MKAALLKRLFAAIGQGASRDVAEICKSIVEAEKQRGHVHLARDLEDKLADYCPSKSPPAQRKQTSSFLTHLPSSKRDSAPLIQVIERVQLRHHMVLPTAVEGKFKRIEDEYAARFRLAKFGLVARKRILLYGPPGCGKSLGAERLAWATGLPLYKVRFDSLISSYFGETANNLGKVFEAAAQEPCALFLDECDTIARTRGANNDIGEASRVVNMLLQLLEEFRGDGLVIAATNHYHSLDSAIFRRFDESVEVPKPGIVEIGRLLFTSLESLGVEKGVDLEVVAASLDGFSFSEVEKIANNAAKRCVMSGRKVVSALDLRIAAKEINLQAE